MYTETGNRLRANSKRILALWQERAKREVLGTHTMTSLVLRDSVGDYVDQLAETLSNSGKSTALKIRDKADRNHFAKKHAGERAASVSYTLAELIYEFHILRQVIFLVLEESAPLAPGERDIIINTIEQTVNDAASHFAETHLETQEQFTLTLAHDLRSPISVIKYSGLIIRRLLEKPEPEIGAINERLDKIDGTVTRLNAMLQELLDVSRVRAGKSLAIITEEMRLDLLARDAVRELTEVHGPRFELKADEPVSGIWNKDGVRRIIDNLVTNAVKYGSPTSPVTITVEQDAHNAKLTVHNEGNPIAIEDQPILFEKYFKTATAESETGWGLGLALVKGMAQAHQGSVSVRSSAEEGTRFTVVLPKDSD